MRSWSVISLVVVEELLIDVAKVGELIINTVNINLFSVVIIKLLTLFVDNQVNPIRVLWKRLESGVHFIYVVI